MGGFGQLFPSGATLFPPLDLIYLASYLAERDLSVELLECLALHLNRDQLCARIAGDPFGRVLLVIRTSAPTLDWDLEIARDIKAARGNLDVLIYGPVVAAVSARIQKEACVDYIVKGDPEAAVAQLALEDGAPAPGLMYRSAFGWTESAAAVFEKNLDRLPFPKWELLPFQRYKLPKSSAHADVPFLPMWTSRGCPIGCHYCPYPVGQGLPWRARSAENVVDEIEHLVRDLGIRYILFRDPMFSLNQRRVLAICEEIVRRGLKFEWRCETRVDYLNPETLRAMAAAGCEGINLGIESSDVAIQKGVGRRPIPPARIMDCLDLCRVLGIKTFGFFIIGLPGDTVETILDTIRFAIDLNPTWVQFTAASPFIGTRLREWAVSRGFAGDDEYAYINSHEVWIGNENLTKDQVRTLFRFARFFQTYLINRKGVLKQDHAPAAYRVVKRIVDRASGAVAHAMFSFGSDWLRRSLVPAGRN